MSAEAPARAAVGPLLPILVTIGWILVALVLLIPTMFSPMLFDSGGSFWTLLIVFGLLSSLFLCGLSVICGWIAWGVTRQRRGGASRILRGVIYLVPLLGIATAGIGIAGIQLACAGNLNCVA